MSYNPEDAKNLPSDEEIKTKISKELGLEVEVKGRTGAPAEEDDEIDEDSLADWLKKPE